MTAKIKLNAASGGGSVSLKAPSTTTGNATLELQLPNAIGSADHILKNSGTAGTLELSASVNTPIVFAYAPATTQGLSDATWTKNIWLTSEDIDTDSAFSSSTFTVPAGKGGTYYVSAGNNLYSDSNNIRNARTAIYKNGVIYSRAHGIVMNTTSSDLRHFQCVMSTVLTLSAGDTIENYMYLDVNSGPLYMSSDNDGVRANFLMVYRISA